MRIAYHLENLIDDLDIFVPTTLSGVVSFVRAHEDFPQILLLVRNSKISSKYLYNQCVELLDEEDLNSDIVLAGLLVIVCNMEAEIDSDMYNELVSRVSKRESDHHWAKGIATSYLLNEVLSEKIRKSA